MSLTIVTHSGSFHSDDVFAIAALQLLHGSDISVVRTRDPAVLATADIVVDVGGEYAHTRARYDHHQPGAPVRENGIPYAGFGLIWRHYGETICGSRAVAERLEERLVIPIDAGDNGVVLAEPTQPPLAPVELHTIIGSFAPPWRSEQSKDDGFFAAVAFARDLLSRLIAREQAALAMDALVAETYAAADDPRILVFSEPVSALTAIAYPEVLLVVCPDDPQSNENWTATAVRVDHTGFASRVTFPDSWRGLRDADLAAVSEIPDAVFCHAAGFLFVAGSRAGALAAAAMVAEGK
jgi:uncharacterized UPF0160 family protein